MIIKVKRAESYLIEHPYCAGMQLSNLIHQSHLFTDQIQR